ncbi:uncharacterized protein LOC575002 [Strongylocentrotus purpuratus]|uniref:MACPF domain-containing protein n=1 Tax=Strongylocentrotus purpuratus TaxID=7668 RepID=A0A7M7NEK9_STRPU|nr:uncharacterized protein LOC575002 [Strongylocentrotus purpuratus]
METPRSVCGYMFALLFLMPALSLGASTKPVPEQVKYVGISYDIIKGNPEGNQKTGGVDPGLLTTRRVLKLTYDNGKVTADNEYRVPDEVDFVRRSSSYTSQEKDTFYGTKSYAKKLSHQVNVDVDVSAVFASFQFAASHQYQSIKNDENTKGYVYFSEQTIQNYGSIRYLEALANTDGFEPSREFRVAVCGLPTTYDKAAYMTFLSDWGTHVVTEAQLGSRSGTTYREDTSSFIKDSTRDMSNSVSVGGSYKIVSASLSVDMDRFTKTAASQEKFGKVYKEYTVGSLEYNEPISIDLIGLNEVLDSKFWTRQTDYETSGDCPANWQRGTIQANILTAFNDYPSYNDVTPSEDIQVTMTLAWPDGKYALPEAATLAGDTCPATAFTWDFGMLYQNTDTSGANTCSKGNHLTNYCDNESLRSYYCVKSTPTASSSSWSWMPGVYCIYKVGTTCPDGFTGGNIRWNDVSRGVDPDYNTMPAGTYTGGPTEIEYCCREDGSAANPIILPAESSFYLMKFHGACQTVLGMTVTEESLEWATKEANPVAWQDGAHPKPGNTGHNVKIYYCFYQPETVGKRGLGLLKEDAGEVKKELEEVRELVNLLENQLDHSKSDALENKETEDEDKSVESAEVEETEDEDKRGGLAEEELRKDDMAGEDEDKKFEEIVRAMDLELRLRDIEHEDDENVQARELLNLLAKRGRN